MQLLKIVLEMEQPLFNFDEFVARINNKNATEQPDTDTILELASPKRNKPIMQTILDSVIISFSKAPLSRNDLKNEVSWVSPKVYLLMGPRNHDYEDSIVSGLITIINNEVWQFKKVNVAPENSWSSTQSAKVNVDKRMIKKTTGD